MSEDRVLNDICHRLVSRLNPEKKKNDDYILKGLSCIRQMKNDPLVVRELMKTGDEE